MSREWTSNLPFAKTISVGFMQPRDVARISDMTNELTNPQDVTPMGLANLVLDVTGEEKVMSGILRRVLHTIQD